MNEDVFPIWKRWDFNGQVSLLEGMQGQMLFFPQKLSSQPKAIRLQVGTRSRYRCSGASEFSLENSRVFCGLVFVCIGG